MACTTNMPAPLRRKSGGEKRLRWCTWLPVVVWSALAAVAMPARAESGTVFSLGAALRAALAANRDVLIGDAQVQGAQASVLRARGAFDPEVSLSLIRSEDVRPASAAERIALQRSDELRSRSSSLDLGVEKSLESGLVLSGSARSAFASDRFSSLAGNSARQDLRLRFGIRVPLARGSGENLARTSLGAARLESEAAGERQRFLVSLALRDTAQLYWDYLARWRQLDVALGGERRTGDFLDELRKLIAADEAPAADMDLALANHAERIDARIAAGQAVLEARHALGRAMGLDGPSTAALVGPYDDFPALADQAHDVARWTEQVRDARDGRGDWKALELSIAAARQRLAGARDAARPELDIEMAVSSAALREGARLSDTPRFYGEEFRGPSVMAQLNYRFPVGNLVGAGLIGEAAATLTQLEIEREDLAVGIELAIRQAAARLEAAQNSLKVSQDVVKRYARSLENERTRRRLGVATLIDVIGVEDRYFRALLDDTSRRRNYAAAMVALAHEMDLLVRPVGGQFELLPEGFIDLGTATAGGRAK